MAVTLQCARCMHEQKIDDDKLEKGVPCKICHHLIKQRVKAKANAKSSSDNGSQSDLGIKSGPPAAKSEKPAAAASAGRRPKPPKNDDDDERRRPSRRKRPDNADSSSMMFILLGGGVVVVLAILCGGGGIGAYLMFGGNTPNNEPIAQADPPRVEIEPAPNPNHGPNPNPGLIFNPNPNPQVEFPNPGPFQPFPQREVLDPNNPNDIGRVIVLLKGPEQQRGPAYTWLKAANPEHPRRAEVAKLLEPIVAKELQNPFAFAGDFFPGFFRWATKDNVPTLKRLAENTAFNPSDNSRRQEAMLALGRLKEGSAADNIASKLGNAFDGDTAYRALVEMGSVAEGSVLKRFNDPNGGGRQQARDLLKAYNTSADKILTQCVADLDAADNNRRNAAVQWFASAPVDEKRRSEVARALNKSIPKANFFFEKDLAKVIETWGTAENVPALVKRLDANKTFGDGDAIRILGKLKHPDGLKAIARAMAIFHVEAAAKAALKEAGPDAEPAVVEALLATKDNRARGAYVNFLGEIGTIKVGAAAINQVALANPQDRFLMISCQQALKSIQDRGK